MINRKIYGLTTVLDNYKIRYIGTTVKPCSNRLYQHIQSAIRYDAKSPLYDWIRSRTEDGYNIIIVKIEENISNINIEQFWISNIGHKLLNLYPGGYGRPAGSLMTIEQRERISAGLLNSNRNYTEQAKKTAKALLGRKLSSEHVQALKDAKRPKWSDEQRKNIEITNSSIETKQLRSESAKKRSMTPEARAALSLRGKLGAAKRWNNSIVLEK